MLASRTPKVDEKYYWAKWAAGLLIAEKIFHVGRVQGGLG